MDFIARGVTVFRVGKQQNNAGYVQVNGTTVHSSDDRLKHNETPIIGALETIRKLLPLNYDRTTEFKEAGYNGPRYTPHSAVWLYTYVLPYERPL